MEVTTSDPNIIEALQAALGHPPPFTADECSKLRGPLLLRHATDLSILKHCPNLRRLEIFASDIRTLDDLSGLESLETLRVTCSTVRSIAALSDCPALESVELVLNLIEDASPLTGLRRLKSGSLAGNPWTPASYHEIIPQMQSRPSEPGTRAPLLDISNEADWQLTRSLMERGFRASFAHIDTRPVLVRPGPPLISNADCDFIELPASIIRMEMKRAFFTVESLFEEFIEERGAGAPPRSFDFHSHRLIGTSADAVAWIGDSSLPLDAKGELAKFVRKFPSLIFYKEDDIFLDRMEAALKVRFPRWFRETRKVLAFVMPHDTLLTRFESFDKWSPRSDNLGHTWYTLGLIGVNADQRGLIEENHLFPIGQWVEAGYSNFAISIAEPEEDQRVYEFDQEDISGGRLPASDISVVFDSYAAMLGHINAFKIYPDGEIISALHI